MRSFLRWLPKLSKAGRFTYNVVRHCWIGSLNDARRRSSETHLSSGRGFSRREQDFKARWSRNIRGSLYRPNQKERYLVCFFRMPDRKFVISSHMDAWPTVFHLTQYKAGSQWIYNILKRCAPIERLVTPKVDAAHALKYPILDGHIYPTVYLTKNDFDQIIKPANTTFFIVLRDLRDITVSLYFSLKSSHIVMGKIAEKRQELCRRDLELGLIWLIENEPLYNADIGRSWADSGEKWIRYEELLNRDTELLEEALLDRCHLPIQRTLLRQAILGCRFEEISGGRRRGVEDVHSHFRKGVSGDWREYFSAPVKSVFKERCGDVLIACGYEKSNDW